MTTPYVGQIAPTPRPARARVLRILLSALLGSVFLACGLVVLAIIGSDTGVTGVLVGLALAAVPVFVVVPALLWLDRFEAEPTGLLLFAFGWGAAVATLVAILVNSTSIALLKASGGDVTVGAIVVAPIVEETCKGAAVLLVFLYRRREFDGVIDGIVYAGMAGIGFAFTENVLYLGRALADSGVDGLAATFVLRCIFGPFAHPLFTMATGVGFGVAVTTRRRAVRYLAPILGWLTAVVLHSLWNLSAVAGLRGFITAYVVLQVPIFVAALGFALWSRRREGHLIGQHLVVYAETGWLTPAEVEMLASMPARRRARAGARAAGGPSAAHAMRGFQDAASELALLRERMSRAAAGPDAPRTERDRRTPGPRRLTGRSMLAGCQQGGPRVLSGSALKLQSVDSRAPGQRSLRGRLASGVPDQVAP
jgi:RsiW-degrading membrane proteinase PrsW (M82 family)